MSKMYSLCKEKRAIFNIEYANLKKKNLKFMSHKGI